MVLDLVGEKTVLGDLAFCLALEPDNHMAGMSTFVELAFFDAESPGDERFADEFLGEVDVVDDKSLYCCHCFLSIDSIVALEDAWMYLALLPRDDGLDQVCERNQSRVLRQAEFKLKVRLRYLESS